MPGWDYEWTTYITVVQYLAICLLVDYFFLMLKPKRGRNIKDYLLLYIWTAFVHTVTAPLLEWGILYPVVYQSLFFIGITRVFEYTVKELVLAVAGLNVISISGELLTWFLVGGVYERYGPMTALGVCIGYVYVFAGNMLAFVLRTSIKEKIPLKNLWLFAAFPIFEVVLLMAYVYEMRPLSVRVIWIGGAILVLGYVVQRVLIEAFWDVLEKIRVEEKLTELYEKRQTEMDYYTIAAEHIQEMRMLRHEFANQLQTVYTMLTHPGHQGMKEAVYETVDALEWMQPMRYCENVMLNAILVKKVKDAAAEKIAVEIKVEASENLQIEKIDLCSICCNLIDNAVEAGRSLAQKDRRNVCLEIGYEDDAFYIQTENYTDQTQRNVLLKKRGTTKAHPEEHGYGLMLVKQLTEKYKGVFTQELDEERLRVTVRLPIQTRGRMGV